MTTDPGRRPSPRVLIVGAGPAGLGAGERLRELGHENFIILEARDHAGGLSASRVDPAGFTWDIGGHVAFSRSPEFHALFERHAPDALGHTRVAFTRCLGADVPYPFQDNLRRLPVDAMLECLFGLIDAQGPGRLPDSDPRLRRFDHWLTQTFGEGLCRLFFRPDNLKRWAAPLDRLSSGWIADRVQVIDLKRAIENVIRQRDAIDWGPNAGFRFPRRGGTGALWQACADALGDRVEYGRTVAAIDAGRRRARLADGREEAYDVLINTMPLDALFAALADAPARLRERAGRLEHNAIHIVGIGLARPAEDGFCWMYFPEERFPFHRVTNFARYSPWNVPGGEAGKYSSFMCEVTTSVHKPVEAKGLAGRVVDGLIDAGLMTESDRGRVVSAHAFREEYAYPLPTLERDDILAEALPWLEGAGILSRGRFGAWRYEEGNMDHCYLAGRAAAETALAGASVIR